MIDYNSKQGGCMSKYSTNVTQFKDKSLLILALGELGFNIGDLEVNANAQQLYDYTGKATHYTDALGDRAEIIIRRKYVGSAANDIGFRANANGRYEAIISAFDRSSNGYNEQWLGRLTAAYARQGVIAKMQKQGYRYVPDSARKNGKTELVFVQA
jgi:hypothetical protein